MMLRECKIIMSCFITRFEKNYCDNQLEHYLRNSLTTMGKVNIMITLHTRNYVKGFNKYLEFLYAYYCF